VGELKELAGRREAFAFFLKSYRWEPFEGGEEAGGAEE